MSSYHDGLEMDQECIEILGWSCIEQVTPWDATNVNSEWKAGKHFIGDALCWVQKLRKVNPEIVLAEKLFFKPKCQEALYANSWELVYDEDGDAINTFLFIRYLGSSQNFALTAQTLRDEWLKTWAYVIATYGKKSTDLEYLISYHTKVTFMERRELEKLITTSGHKILGLGSPGTIEMSLWVTE
ncbi:hypothetical protein C8J56DRAFT_902509 [Mycena floridula]|nr:hypothetical protein C8J56DRAFT_902509 [Mycena floridula]